MNRRSFLKWVGAAGAAAAAAPSIVEAAADFDPERLLWVPGKKTIIDLGKEVKVEQETVDKTIEHLTGVGMPRYHLTVGGHGTMLFDDQWRLLNGGDLLRRGMPPKDVERFAREMARPDGGRHVFVGGTGRHAFAQTSSAGQVRGRIFGSDGRLTPPKPDYGRYVNVDDEKVVKARPDYDPAFIVKP